MGTLLAHCYGESLLTSDSILVHMVQSMHDTDVLEAVNIHTASPHAVH